MARRVLADFDAELLLRLANRTDITATQRAFFIDDAYRWICDAFEHAELQTQETATLSSAASSFAVGASDRLWHPVHVYDNTNGKILVPEDLDRIRQGALRSAKPSRYCYWGGEFLVDVLANANTTIHVFGKNYPAELAGGGSPVIDRLFDAAIIMIAAMIGFQTVRDFTEAHIQWASFENWTKDMKLPVHQEKLNDLQTGVHVRIK